MPTKIHQDHPNWLNNQLFEMIFKKSENNKTIKVLNIYVKPATSKGDNYLSEMWRVNVEYSRGFPETVMKTSVIVKVSPIAEGFEKEMSEKIGTFQTEIMMITDVLKQMNESLGGKNPLSPRGYHCEIRDPAYLVMEDLAPLGYKMGNRLEGLDLQHCILAIRGLARFHASSIAICENNPGLKNRFRRGIFSGDIAKILPPMKEFFISNAKTLSDKILQWPEVDRKIAKKIFKLSDDIYELAVKYSAFHEEGFNVINHGDFWLNNMMFRYDDFGRPVSHIMVDFQFPRYTTPAFDLSYFFGTSMTENVYENHGHQVLQEYHETLTHTMKEIGCKLQPPTLQDLKKHLQDRAVLEMLITISFCPIFLAEKNEVLSADDLVNKNENPHTEYKCQTLRKVLSKRLQKYDKMGLLDVQL